jgi:phospholipid/cholesterol/gamma-HCH transport system substrate-binding protein
MQKTVPSLGRVLVMVGFALSCFGLLLFLWLAFGGPIPLKPKGYRFDVSFQEAGQLAQEADVRISGVSVGKVKTITADKRTGRSDATIELQRKYAPIPKDSRATLRQKTLLGETYVELTPGHKNLGMVRENGALPPGQVAQTVELDEIFRAFDEKTRNAFRSWMQQLAVASSGRGRDISDALANLAPFAQDTSKLLEILNAQQPEVRNLVNNTGVVFSALSERDAQLRSLIQNSNRVFQTTADRNRELQQAFVALPTFEHESELTLNRLTDFSRKTNPLVTSRSWPRISRRCSATSIRSSRPRRPACRRCSASPTSYTRCWPSSIRRCARPTPRSRAWGVTRPSCPRSSPTSWAPRRPSRPTGCTTCAPRTHSTSRTSPSIRAG